MASSSTSPVSLVSKRKSLKLKARQPEPLAHAPPEALELIAESA